MRARGASGAIAPARRALPVTPCRFRARVKFAVNTETNERVAIKILDKEKIQKQVGGPPGLREPDLQLRVAGARRGWATGRPDNARAAREGSARGELLAG